MNGEKDRLREILSSYNLKIEVLTIFDMIFGFILFLHTIYAPLKTFFIRIFFA